MRLRLIRDRFSINDLRLISILRDRKCRSRDLFRENFLLSLFHSTKIIVVIENLYLCFTLKHKHLVICFTVKGMRTVASLVSNMPVGRADVVTIQRLLQ